MLTADLDYAYSNARVRALKSKLLNRDRLRELLDVSSLDEFIEMLEESPYKESMVNRSVSSKGLDMVKGALDDNLLSTIEKVVGFSPAKARPFLWFYLQYWEVNNLKKIIALRAQGRAPSKEELLVVGGVKSSRLLDSFLAAKDLKGCVDAFAGTEYRGAIAKVGEEFARTQDFRAILSALDDYYYNKLYSQARPVEDAHLKAFIRLWVDTLNTISILRMKLTKVAGNDMRRHLISTPDSQFASSLIAAQTIQEAIGLVQLRTHATLSEQAVKGAVEKGSVSRIEVELQAMLLRAASSTLRMSVLSPGALVTYLYLKQEEVHALRKIAYATVLDAKQGIRGTIYAAE